MKEHIIHISTTFNSRSGSAKRTYEIMRACVQHGYKVSLICGSSNDLECFDLTDIDVEIIPELRKPISIVDDLVSFYKLYRWMRSHAPDIVHTHLAKAGILGRLAGYFSSVRFIVHTVHGPTFSSEMNAGKSFLFRAIERIFAKITDVLIFVGEDLRDMYLKAGISPKKSIEIIRTARSNKQLNRVLLDAFQKKNLLMEVTNHQYQNNIILAIVGRLVPVKCQIDAVKVLIKLRNTGMDCVLLIVGEALVSEEKSYKQTIVNFVQENNVQNYVFFTGFRKDVLDLMDAADVILLTSKYEGLPNVAVEAILARTPLVSYQVSGVKSLIPNELIVDQGDVDQMSKKIVYALKNKVDIEASLRKIGSKIRQQYTVTNMIAAKISLYEQLLKNGEIKYDLVNSFSRPKKKFK